jgi:hypothetical protein
MSEAEEVSEVKTSTKSGDAEVEHGRMDELEIDLAQVLKEDTEFSYESNRSPFPEGMLFTAAPHCDSSRKGHALTVQQFER